MNLTNAQRIIALLWLSALATVSAGCGKEETFVVVTTQIAVEEPSTIEDSLYAGDEEQRRGLRSNSSISASSTQVDRELGKSPYICCWLCQGWPAGQCFIWSLTFQCRKWEPKHCERRELEEDFDLEEETRHHRLQAKPAVDNKECKKIIDEEEKKLKKARLLYNDWGAMERSKFDCVTAVPECEEEDVKEEKEKKIKEDKEDKEKKEKAATKDGGGA